MKSRDILYLFRALLRESTYLPDSQARTWVWSHIVARFRDCKGIKASWPEGRQQALVGNARQSLLVLQRANSGKLDQLSKVLYYSYGRKGKRRHELMRPLLMFESKDLQSQTNVIPNNTPRHVEEPIGGIASVLVQQAEGVEQPSRFTPVLPSRLAALLESQLAANIPGHARPPMYPRVYGLNLPDKNRLGRKLPDCRRANLIRRWYGSILERALPPLPDEEWDRLKGLISGAIKWEGPRMRRPGIDTHEPAIAVQSNIVLNRELGLVAKEPKPHSPMHGDHCLTLRYMRRLWMKIFAACPRMTWDSQKEIWEIQWGHHSVPKPFAKVAKSDKILFEGVDSQGKMAFG